MILAGDIGGTNARLALFDGDKKKPVAQHAFQSREYRSLEAVLGAFLSKAQVKKIHAATFGIAGPVVQQRCMGTNLPWVVDAKVVAKKTGLKRVTLLNDLVALSYGTLTLPPSKLRILQGKTLPKKTGGNLAVIAAGTGLGEAALIWNGDAHAPLATEGGHTDFAARTPLEWELHQFLASRFGRVSYERIVAGPGFSALYDFFRDVKGVPDTPENIEHIASAADRNAVVNQLGIARASEPAARAVDLFLQIYGAEAGNVALKTFATAGVFVAGAIAGRLANEIASGAFMEAFVDKGRFKKLLESMPVALVLDTDIGLAGSRLHASTRPN